MIKVTRGMKNQQETPQDAQSPVDRLVIRKLKQTCPACPSQWEATLDDGRMLYFRYRWGYLSIDVSKQPTDDVRNAIKGNEVFGRQINHGLHGILEQGDLIKLTENIIEYPETGEVVSASLSC